MFCRFEPGHRGILVLIYTIKVILIDDQIPSLTLFSFRIFIDSVANTFLFQDFQSSRYRFSVVVDELRQAKANEYRYITIVDAKLGFDFNLNFNLVISWDILIIDCSSNPPTKNLCKAQFQLQFSNSNLTKQLT